MIFTLRYNIKIEIIEYSDSITLICHPFNAGLQDTISFVYYILFSRINQYGLNETLYEECKSFVKGVYRLQRHLLTQKPIHLYGTSYGGAVAQVLAGVLYNLRFNIDQDLSEISQGRNYTNLQLPTAVYSFGAFRVADSKGIQFLESTRIPIYNYVACKEDKEVDLVSLLPGKDYSENINTIYYDVWNRKEYHPDTNKLNTSTWRHLLYFTKNLYKNKHFLNEKELLLHNTGIYSEMGKCYNIFMV